MRRGSLTALVCVSVLAAACGDDDGGGNGGGDAVPLEDVPAEIADVFCDAIESCFGTFFDIIPQGDCRANLESEFRNGQFSVLEAAVAAGRVEYDGALAPDCFDAYRDLECDVLTERGLEACEDALRGTVPLGEACSIDAECAGVAFCDVDLECPGVCAAPRALGEACANDDECVNGLNCDGSVCVERATAGEACEGPEGATCQVGLACSGATDTDAGTCASTTTLTAGALGEACDPTALDLCDVGLSCTFAGIVDLMPSYECREKAGSGGPCNLGFPEPCPDGEYCDDASPLDGTAGTCTALPVEGETCLTASGRPLRCDVGLVCVDDVCSTRKANGGACSDASECYSERCVDGECAGPELCTAD